MSTAIPEQAIVDAALFDPLAAAALLSHFANSHPAPLRAGSIDDIVRSEGFAAERLQLGLAALVEVGVVRKSLNNLTLAVGREEALLYAALLRGAAYAKYRQTDSNQVEITLSPPAHPSRLMDVLPKQGFSWARLYHTKDSLVQLASEARHRFVIVSPFLDEDGLEWIGQLIDATAAFPIERTLIVRGREQKDIELLRTHARQFVAKGVKVLRYAISHDPGLRTPTVETFHAKILLADHDKAYIGSANMTRSSRDFSMECGVIIRGPGVKPVATLVEAMKQVASELPI